MSVKIADLRGIRHAHISPSGWGATSGVNTPSQKEGAMDVNVVNPLNVKVALSGDIEIGAVELKDGSSDARATVSGGAVWFSPRDLPPGAATSALQLGVATSALQNTQVNRQTSAVIELKEINKKVSSAITELQVINSLTPSKYDYINCSYNTSGKISQAVYKIGGSGGATISTLDIGYNTSGKISSVNKS